MRSSLRTKKILLVLIVISFLILLGNILFVSEMNIKPNEQLRQLASRLASSLRFGPTSAEQCRKSDPNRTEEEARRCFQLLAEEIASWKVAAARMQSRKKKGGARPKPGKRGNNKAPRRGQVGSRGGGGGKRKGRREVELLRWGSPEQEKQYQRRMESIKAMLAKFRAQSHNATVTEQGEGEGEEKPRPDPVEIRTDRKAGKSRNGTDSAAGSPGLARTQSSSPGERAGLQSPESRVGEDRNREASISRGTEMLPFRNRTIETELNGRKTRDNQSAETSPLTVADIRQRFADRRATLLKACQRYGNSTLFKKWYTPMSTAIVVPAFWPTSNITVRYCPVEKTGSTTWRKLLEDIRHNRKLKAKKKKKASRATRSRTKGARARKGSSTTLLNFMFTREPYSRLLSAYFDKLFCPNTIFWYAGIYIVRSFRPNASDHSRRCGHDATFPEFIRYVIHAQVTGKRRDGHFVPTHDHCDLCGEEILYDYIGHLETHDEDMPYLLGLMRDGTPVAPSSHRQRHNRTDDFDHATLQANTAWVLRRMRLEITDCMTMYEAGRRLWKKWHVRGLISKDEPFPFSAKKAEVVSEGQFLGAALAALGRSGSRAERRAQKREALREAYSTVPLEDRLMLKEVLFLDFQMFGFDPEPDEVFPKTPFVKEPGFSYLEF